MKDLSLKVRRARTIFQRARGLMLTKRMPSGFDGLLLEPCHAVHTFGMNYAIDIVFIDKHLHVLKVVEKVPPLKPYIACRNAYGVLELGAGCASGYSLGQKIELRYL